jgi:ribosomal protein S18 acetylase RimI-like enzyme
VIAIEESLRQSLPAGVTIRVETDDDSAFCERLYASTRADELAPVPWPDEAKAQFLRSQYALQRAHYRTHYTGASFLVVEREDRPIGRVYLWQGSSELRIIDIALLPDERGHGLGTLVMSTLIERARDAELVVSLHVEAHNPAQRLYKRLGFRFVEDRGVYHLLEWRPPQAPGALDAADFEPLVHQPFTLRTPDGREVPLQLDEVNTRAPMAPGARRAFSLVFTSPGAGHEPQHIFRVEHATLGVLEMFLVPLGPGPRGMRYEAVFS